MEVKEGNKLEFIWNEKSKLDVSSKIRSSFDE